MIGQSQLLLAFSFLPLRVNGRRVLLGFSLLHRGARIRLVFQLSLMSVRKILTKLCVQKSAPAYRFTGMRCIRGGSSGTMIFLLSGRLRRSIVLMAIIGLVIVYDDALWRYLPSPWSWSFIRVADSRRRSLFCSLSSDALCSLSMVGFTPSMATFSIPFIRSPISHAARTFIAWLLRSPFIRFAWRFWHWVRSTVLHPMIAVICPGKESRGIERSMWSIRRVERSNPLHCVHVRDLFISHRISSKAVSIRGLHCCWLVNQLWAPFLSDLIFNRN